MADVVYADRTDFARFGVQASATRNVPDASIDAALQAASAVLDSKFRARYSLPLLEWDMSIRIACCRIAALYVMGTRGFSQDAGLDVQIKEMHDWAIDWADGVERQRTHPNVVQTPVATPRYEFPQISSGAKRGW